MSGIHYIQVNDPKSFTLPLQAPPQSNSQRGLGVSLLSLGASGTAIYLAATGENPNMALVVLLIVSTLFSGVNTALSFQQLRSKPISTPCTLEDLENGPKLIPTKTVATLFSQFRTALAKINETVGKRNTELPNMAFTDPDMNTAWSTMQANVRSAFGSNPDLDAFKVQIKTTLGNLLGSIKQIAQRSNIALREMIVANPTIEAQIKHVDSCITILINEMEEKAGENLRKIEVQLTEAKRHLAEKTSRGAQSSDIRALRQQISQLQSDKNTLIKEHGRTKATLRSVQEEKKSIERQLSSLQRTSKDEISSLQEKINNLQTQSEDSQEKQTKLEAEKRKLNSRIKKLEARIKRASENKENLGGNISELETELEEAKAKITKLENKNERITKQAKMFAAAANKLTIEVAALKKTQLTESDRKIIGQITGALATFLQKKRPPKLAFPDKNSPLYHLVGQVKILFENSGANKFHGRRKSAFSRDDSFLRSDDSDLSIQTPSKVDDSFAEGGYNSGNEDSFLNGESFERNDGFNQSHVPITGRPSIVSPDGSPILRHQSSPDGKKGGGWFW